jgi:hypothetical protein
MTTISTNNRGQRCRRAALFRPLFGGPHDDNGPLRQQQCALGSRLTEIALHCFYRRLVIGHPDRPTDHVYPTSLEGISIIGVMPKFRRFEITLTASLVWKGMAANLFKEPPQVKVLHAAIMMDVMTGRALAQKDQPQPVGI